MSSLTLSHASRGQPCAHRKIFCFLYKIHCVLWFIHVHFFNKKRECLIPKVKQTRCNWKRRIWNRDMTWMYFNTKIYVCPYKKIFSSTCPRKNTGKFLPALTISVNFTKIVRFFVNFPLPYIGIPFKIGYDRLNVCRRI